MDNKTEIQRQGMTFINHGLRKSKVVAGRKTMREFDLQCR